MATSTILLGMAAVLAHSNSVCFAQCFIKADGPHPWLIRIWLDKPTYEPTIAHGSLISPSKVLTGAHIVDKLGEKGIDYLKPLGEKTLAMTGYYPPTSCVQTQYAKKVFLHWNFENRKNAPFKYCQIGEFALLIPMLRFETLGSPFLIKLPYGSKALDIESWLMDVSGFLTNGKVMKRTYRMVGNETGTVTGQAGSESPVQGQKPDDTNKPAEAPPVLTGPADDMVSVYMFADREPNNSNIIDANQITTMSWLKCKDTENFKKIAGDSDLKDPQFTNYTFFCSEKIPAQKGTEALKGGVGYDWHLGAPVMVNWKERKMTMMAVGQFLFWTGESGVPFVFSTFTRYTFAFIEERYPGPTPTSTKTPPSATTASPLINPDPRVSPTFPTKTLSSGGDDHRQYATLIAFGLLTSNFNV